MGRRGGGKKKRKRTGGGSRRRKGHESGPERTGDTDLAAGSCSPAWNSLDESSLLDYSQNAACGSGDEVEVAKRLSYLNFSVIPCAPEPHNLDCEPHAQGPPTDVELLSELTSATYLEREDGGNRREGRKRASRRRPNKRAKKMRSSVSCLCHFVREGSLPAESGDQASVRACERCLERQGKIGRRHRGERFNPLSRGERSAGRRGKGKSVGNRSESSTPVNLPPSSGAHWMDMECEAGLECSTDTSAIGDAEMAGEHEDTDHTPPAELTSVGELLSDELYGEESELSETTTDRYV